MNLYVLQFDPQTRSPIENVKYIVQRTCVLKASIIVLPELFLTPYVSSTVFSKKDLGVILKPLQDVALKNRSAYVGSILLQVGEKCTNRFVCIQDTITYPYAKRLLYGKEKNLCTAGTSLWSGAVRGVHMGAQICLDIIEPLWSKQLARRGVRVLVNPQSVSVDYLHTIAHARSLENNMVVCVANRCGKEKTGEIYLGRSAIYAPQKNSYAGKSQLLICLSI